MLQVMQQCLEANQDNQGPENIFATVVESRARLALMLIQKLSRATLSITEINNIIGNVLSIITSLDAPFSAGTLPYTRVLLKIIFATLRAFPQPKDGEALPSEAWSALIPLSQTVLTVLDRVVARGFRSLATLIHDPEQNSSPEDIALLTAVLQACLKVPSMDQSQTQIMNILAAHDAPRVAISLFSWAEKLTDRNDPVYGELSLLFLVELSTLPLVAEQLACEGLLGSLMSANLINYMRRACNLGPDAEAAVAQRCYGIWTKGMLPLMLNLLTALGATIAPEIAFVLNEFPHLMRQSVERFEAPGASRTTSKNGTRTITLIAVSEVHCLALITSILGALRANNKRDIAEVAWDASAVLEHVDFWLVTNKLLKERLMPIGQLEIDWTATPPQKPGEDGNNVSRLEERVVEQMQAVRIILNEEFGE